MAYVRIEYSIFQAITDTGAPAVGYLVETYQAGTVDTPATTYYNKDLAPAHANANPIVLDARGECRIFVSSAIKWVLKTPAGVTVATEDYVGEQQNTYIITGDASAGTTNNNYVVNVTPTYVAIPDLLTLVMKPDTDNLDTIVTQTFTGTGINDGIFSGPYVGTTAGSIFTVEIDGVASPNTFRWKKDGGAWTAGVAITAASQNLIEGISIKFAEVVGHTLADKWTVEVMTPARLNFCALGNKIIYKNVDGTLKALDGGDMKNQIPATLVFSDDQNCWVLNNPSLPVLSALIPYRNRKELTGAYSPVAADIGTELSCTGTWALTWPACATLPNHWWWVKNIGSGIITLTAAVGEVFKYGGSTTGFNTMPLQAGEGVMIVTNGVDLHVFGYASGMFVKETVLTAGVSITTQPGTRSIKLRMMGGGGGGGGVGTNAAPNPKVAGGGGAGGYAEKFFTVSPSTAYTYAIGAAGTAGDGATGGTGGNGGNTTFTVGATTVTAFGGSGGTGGGAIASVTVALGGAGGVVSTNGDLNGAGEPGNPGIGTPTDSISGKGGSTQWGKGGNSVTDAAGAVGVGYGAGGSGASDFTGLATHAGGAGAQGCIIVTEYS